MLKLIVIAAILGMSIPALLHRVTGRIKNDWLRFLVCVGFGLGMAISFSLAFALLLPGWFGCG
jgi:hypothetical protein